MSEETTVTTTIKPMLNRVFLRKVVSNDKSQGGLDLSAAVSTKAPTIVCEVVAIGPGKLDKRGERVPMAVAVGDRVVISAFVGEKTKVDGEELIVAYDDDIFMFEPEQ